MFHISSRFHSLIINQASTNAAAGKLIGIILDEFKEALKYSGSRPAAGLEAAASVGVAKRAANKSALP
ncbi:hypothetical protein D3C78_1803510 [compost metagenome]